MRDYLSRGYRVLGIEANPAMAAYCFRRFEREIAEKAVTILDVGIAENEGVLPFYVFKEKPEFDTFCPPVQYLELSHHTIDVSCRPFRSIIEEFGTPYYVKIDIEGKDSCCIKDLRSPDLPRYISFERYNPDEFKGMLSILNGLGYDRFKQISQSSFLPIEYPAVTPQQKTFERSLTLLTSRNLVVRAVRKAGARRWFQRSLERGRRRDRWIFPHGSSGPFGNDLPGRWFAFEEICEVFDKAEAARASGCASIFWTKTDFWADCHAAHQLA